MKDKSEIIVNKIRLLLKQKVHSFRGLYFFGSRAKQVQQKYSDYDIAVILDEDITWQRKDEVRNLVYDIMLEYDIIIDIHVYSVKEFINPSTPFRSSIKSEGIFYGI